MSRRERARAATIGEIKDAARAQLRETGAAALSLRAVAGAVGMSPAGLYRYYDGRDALLTALIADGFTALAEAVEDGLAGAADDPAERLLGAVRAFRGWAVAHPQEFGLLYGAPVPGYAAPVGGQTSAASRRLGVAVLRPLVEAWHAGRLRPGPEPAPDPATTAWAALFAPDFPLAAASAVLAAWTRLHGLVILEVFGHLRWLGPDTGPLAASQLRALVEEAVEPRPVGGAPAHQR
jgi:AcrR family transcriptional regulator